LTVRSNVIGDKVFIDGKDYGATRLDVALEPGEHNIKIEKEGYDSYETRIQLASNQTVRGVLAQIGGSSKLSTSGAEQQPVKRAVISHGARGMIRIKGGRFDMGSPSYEGGRDSDEVLHSVSIRPFKLAKTEVTVGQFRKFTDTTGYRTDAERNKQKDGCYTLQSGEWGYQAGRSWRDPGFRQTNAHPVVCVSFSDAMAYIDWLNRTSGQRYRLPTEAEWEYAARAGTSTARYWGDSSNSACDYANVYDNAGKSHYNFSRQHHGCNDGYAATAPVGSFQGNAWGLKDMLGNVWEWTCSDWNTSYEGQEKQCSGNNHASGKRSVRGGAWNNGPAWVRSANRTGFYSWTRYDIQGFRLAQDL
ncbi:MAG: SUMF1/EgtB/PvdO family nonheme iron enzyme, partial [Chloroflexi bacterium]|nr:SUMF1/EgtB/PvdO family nonheme iron enzyme [Chloroflexota bacterium]